LPKWDGNTDHIQLMLQQVYLSNEGNRADFIEAFTKWFVGMVGCAVNDYAVNQQCLVLVGGQSGQKKTTFLNNLVPKHLRLDYLYTGSFDFGNIDHQKFLFQKLIINIDEMSTINKHDEKVLKTVLTAQTFIGRLKYGKYDTKKFRKASFCGSTNDKRFLSDETGNRRYLVFEVSNIDTDEKYNIDMAYAQALHLYNTGFKYWFDTEDIIKINSRNDNYRRVSNEENLILQRLQIPSETEEKAAASGLVMDNGVKFWNATQINNHLVEGSKINVNNITVKTVGEVLEKLGFKYKSRRIEGHAHPYKCYAVKVNTNPVFIDEVFSRENDEYPI
jgi:predicted P-loop ATPase